MRATKRRLIDLRLLIDFVCAKKPVFREVLHYCPGGVSGAGGGGRTSHERISKFRAPYCLGMPTFRSAREYTPVPGKYRPARYSCAYWTATAPSPTADATRLTEPWRTSPTA